MEWVERTDRTVEAAKEFLLDQLGVHEDEAEFEILEEPKPGLFGRVRGQARVRARVAPKAPRVKDERRRKRSNGGGGKGEAGRSDGGRQPKSEGRPPAAPKAEAAPVAAPKADSETAGSRAERPPREPAASVDPEPFVQPVVEFLEQLAVAFGVSATASVEIVDGELEARLDGEGLGALIGPAGGVISAVQELARTYLQKVAKGGSAPRLRVDIGGYRRDRRDALAAFTREVAATVLETGTPHAFEPMGSADRKVVHDTASEIEGIATRSEGDDPRRRVVLTTG